MGYDAISQREAKEKINNDVSCLDYLIKSKSGMYCCPECGSGTHGVGSTGAVKYYPETNTWHCHACGKTGDVIALYRAVNECSFNTALEDLGKRIGIAVRGFDYFSNRNIDKTPKAFRTITKAQSKPDQEATPEPQKDYSDYYTECSSRLLKDIRTSIPALRYLNERGMYAKTIADFQIGFDPKADPAESNHPTPRIILPVSSSHYVARSVDPNTPKQYQKMNPKGAAPGIFNLKAIYEENESRSSIVFIVEGIFDALSIIQLGHSAIALNSIGNVNVFLKQIDAKPTTAGFIIALDNETNTNVQRSVEALEIGLKKRNNKAIVAKDLYGSCKDANEAMIKDTKSFMEALEQQEISFVKATNDLFAFQEKIQTTAYMPHQTGLKWFDEMLCGGIVQQSLLLLMAAPGTGKTTLCQQIAEEMASRKQEVIYLNFEMSREQMLAKAISGRLALNGFPITAMRVLQGYNWTSEEAIAINEELQLYERNNYHYIRYNPNDVSSDLDQINSYLDEVGRRAAEDKKSAPALIVDYLHLISSTRITDSQELIKQSVVALKDYARKYNTFVILIVATNRESNKNGRITMSSGRDSSNIEYTGDYQLSLNYYAIEKSPSILEDPEELSKIQQEKWRRMIIRVLKNRFGIPGKSAKVYFNAANNIFADEADRILAAEGTPVEDGASPFDEDEPHRWEGRKMKIGELR